MPPKQKPGLSKQDYSTPELFIAAVKRLLGIGSFDWDLAADPSNSKSPYGHYSEAQDSLNQTWLGWDGWLWLNPPFANIEPWCEKCYFSAIDGAKIAMLVPASVGADWYKKWVHNHSFVLYLNGRLAFIPESPDLLYPKDCMLILWTRWARGGAIWNWRKDEEVIG